MRCYPTDCKIYAEIKYQLAVQFQNNRQGYVEAKTPFIWGTIRKADEWAQETGWSLGKSAKTITIEPSAINGTL
jgi:hypothetical protein